MARVRWQLLILGTVIGLALAGAGIPGETTATPPIADHVTEAAAYHMHHGAITSPVTLTSRMQFPTEADESSIDAIWLAGFSVVQDGPPQDLVVRWRREGWFDLWGLALETHLDVIPSTLRSQPGSQGSRTVPLLPAGNLMPQAGHVYETTLSYDPKSGYFAVDVVDVTVGQDFYRGAFQLKPVTKALYAGSGLALTSSASVHSVPALVESVEAHPGLVPAGLAWRVVTQQPDGSWVALRRLDRRRPLALELVTGRDVAFPGTLRFLVNDGWNVAELASVESIERDALLPIDAGALPVGQINVVMEYLLNDEVLLSSPRSFSVGVVQMAIGELTIDQAKGVARVDLELTADGELEDVHVEGAVHVEGKPLVTETPPVAWVIDFAETLSLNSEPVRVPFEIPLPEEPFMWRVRIDPSLRVDQAIEVVREMQLGKAFTTGLDGAGVADVLARIKLQYMEEFLPGSSGRATVPPTLEDGSWADVDYTDRSVSNWAAATHLSRVVQLARAYQNPGLRSEALRDEIKRALTFWVERRFRNPNWWYNILWLPANLGDILLLMEGELPDKLTHGALAIMRSEIAQGDAGNYTGANLIWHQTNRLRLALLEHDFEAVAAAFEAMAAEAKVRADNLEGIQADASFHQHGRMLYNGGYGRSFAGDLASLVVVARGTSLFPSEALEALVHLVLDGHQWMVRGRTFDPNSMGRNISRQSSGDASFLLDVTRKLLAVPEVPRRDEIQALHDRLRGVGDPLKGNRHFWTSDFMTHHRPDYYVSLKASSIRTLATEIGNGENLKGHHMGDGMMLIMRSGNEYSGIYPVWDWERLPGTTVAHREHPAQLGGWLTIRGAGDPAGGVSDGQYGVMGMLLRRDGVVARKAWFFFDREVVALGTDISGTTSSAVTTSVNQTRLIGDVVAGTAGEVLNVERNQQIVLQSADWVHHDGIGYIFPNRPDITLATRAQTGSWYDINRSYSEGTVTMPVFSLWYEHGARPTGAGYQYIVVPGLSQEETAAYAEWPGIEVIRNDSSVQAVWHRSMRMVQAIIWSSDGLTTPSGITVSVNVPVVMLATEHDDEVEVTLASLDRQSSHVNVEVRNEHGNRAQLVLTLPDGEYSQQSVTGRATFSRD